MLLLYGTVGCGYEIAFTEHFHFGQRSGESCFLFRSEIIYLCATINLLTHRFVRFSNTYPDVFLSMKKEIFENRWK